MLTVTIPEIECFNNKDSTFITIKAQTLQLEHSLVSLSKWEAKWKKPFIGNTEKTYEEIQDYIPPVWPNERGKQQQMTHLDFAASSDDREAVTKHALECGATFASVQYYEQSTVFIDPVGHPFCIGFFS